MPLGHNEEKESEPKPLGPPDVQAGSLKLNVWIRRDENVRTFQGLSHGAPDFDDIVRRETVHSDNGRVIEVLHFDQNTKEEDLLSALPGDYRQDITTSFWYKTPEHKQSGSSASAGEAPQATGHQPEASKTSSDK